MPNTLPKREVDRQIAEEMAAWYNRQRLIETGWIVAEYERLNQLMLGEREILKAKMAAVLAPHRAAIAERAKELAANEFAKWRAGTG